MGPSLYLDLYSGAGVKWSVEAYDLPERERPSVTFPFASAELSPQVPEAPSAKQLVLRGALLTPFADMVESDSTKSIYVYMYQPKDRNQTLEFERSIEPRYQDYYATLGCFYAGLFDVEGLPGGYLGEILSFEAALPEAKGFVESFEPAPDIARIEDECRTLQERDAPRYLLWLSRPAS